MSSATASTKDGGREIQIMDKTDREILKILQEKFPLVTRPFRHIAVKLVIEESEVIERVSRMKEAGIIRRIGPVYDVSKCGYKSTLIALKAPVSVKNSLVDYINSFENVTHNYERDHDYNIWFTFIFQNDRELEGLEKDLRQRFDVEDILLLPSIKKYKLETNF